MSIDILHRPSYLKMEFYYHKTILLMSMVKDSILPCENLTLDNALKNINEALKYAIVLEDFKKIKKYLFICANIYNMKQEKDKRNNVSIELKKFKLMESTWKKISNKAFIIEEGLSCLKLHAQIHSLMKVIGEKITTSVLLG